MSDEPRYRKCGSPADVWAPIERGPAPDVAPSRGSGGARDARDGRDGRDGRRGRRRRGRRRLFVLLVLLVLAAFVALAVRDYLSPGEVGQRVSVTIAEGSSLKEIAAVLAEKGVVAHATLFVYRVKRDGHEDDLKPGTYKLRVNEPYDGLVAVLVKGAKPPTVRITLPEGLTVAEQATRIAAAVPGFDAARYARIAEKDPPAVQVEGYAKGTTLEGLLFPATYEVRARVKERAFIELQLEALRANLDKVDMTRARKANLTEYDIVIIASLIEGEARVADERELVAAVIWNRLREGMLLQIDAAIQYALGERKPELTYDDYKVESPYNVYKYAGLTPTPINNPGLAAMQAAANPARVDYLYYVARADGSGRHYWSHDYDQFLRDKERAAANAQAGE